MIKYLKKAGILVAVFIVALILFSRALNHESVDRTTELKAASLPVVYVVQQDVRTGELHGHTDQMDAASIAEQTIPVQSGNKIQLTIENLPKDVDTLSYEVRTEDGKRLVEDAKEVSITHKEEMGTVQLTFQDLFQDGTRYLLTLKLDAGQKELYYYTSLQKEGNCDTLSCISFASDFHKKTIEKTDSNSITAYLEPDASANNATLQSVSIKNRLSQITWGKLDVTEIGEPVVNVQEMTESYSSMNISSVISSANEDGSTSYYNVNEYFRIRPGGNRMYLLEYNRTVEEIFQGATASVSGNQVNLGIRSQDVEFHANNAGTGVCFVQQGELWAYDQETGHMVKVYSNRSQLSTDAVDARENYMQHNIRVIKTDESGSIDFIVYGYMNRGEHEGQNGISVCHYDNVTNTVEEYLFLSTKQSYQEMRDMLSQLLYISDAGVFYTAVDGKIYAINVDTSEVKVLPYTLKEGSFKTSETGRYAAWTDGDAISEASVLHVIDLNTEAVSDIKADAGYCIQPLGFMGTDCIYGLSQKSRVESTGSFLADTLKIAEISETGVDILTSYGKTNYLIQGIDVGHGVITLSLLSEDGTGTVTDTITNKDLEGSKSVQVESVTNGTRQTEVHLVFSDKKQDVSVVLKEPKLILPEKSATLSLEEDVLK